jgi:hypothetical protein
MPLTNQTVREMRADKTGATSNQYFHVSPSNLPIKDMVIVCLCYVWYDKLTFRHR